LQSRRHWNRPKAAQGLTQESFLNLDMAVRRGKRAFEEIGLSTPEVATGRQARKDDTMAAAERHANSLRGPRELTESELLRVARLTQSGGTAEACELYVALRLNGKDCWSEQEILHDPKYRQLLDDAAITIWRYSRPDYVFSEEFEELLARAAEMRPLTVRVVDVLYDKFETEKAENARSTYASEQLHG
jgi:hypothetical protein